MAISNNIILDHHHRKDANGRMQLEICLIYQRKSYYLVTGIRVRPEEWAAGRIVNCMGARQLNEQLAMIYERTMTLVNEYIRDGVAFDFNRIKKEVWRFIEQENDKSTMIDWMEDQVEVLNVSESTKKHYRTVVKSLKQYGKMTDWSHVTTEAIYMWDAWLHRLPGQNGRAQIGDASVHNYHKNLKAMLNRAVDFGKIPHNPYVKLRGKFRKGEKENVEYLTEAEMKAIEDLKLPEGTMLEMARDLFVIQMYTGLSYSDVQSFDISQYKWDGKRWINSGERIKTGVPYISSLLPPVVEVLERYGMKVPKLGNADYNHQLKAIGVIAGTSVKLHSHLARHTFATFMLRNGASLENVSRMLGHTNINQTMRYAKVLALSVHEDFDRIAEKLKKV